MLFRSEDIEGLECGKEENAKAGWNYKRVLVDDYLKYGETCEGDV